ncbi:MAG: hypothetical protein M0Z75_12115 [Nitrospiraceae bacterium]|nr:hypothetical protein [Nitrospiraceae bacterium]
MIEEELKKLGDLYARMDEEYGRLSAVYGLTCRDCGENCCSQRFYHHTIAEYLYLLEGLKAAPDELKQTIVTRARIVVESYSHELQAGEIFKLMCPVNFDGLCALYSWRPMICRLHGLPHFFIMPDGVRKTGGGCHRLKGEGKGTASMDRTPFYKELAGIEKSLRQQRGFNERFRKTTAQMIMEMSLELDFDEI